MQACYTPDDLAQAMEQARQEGFAEGRTDGYRQATEDLAASDRRRQVESLEAISQQVGNLIVTTDERVTELEQQLLAFVLAVFEKVAPELVTARSAPRAEAEVREAMAMARGASMLRVHISPAVHAAVGEALVQSASDFEGRVEILADAGLSDGDARVEWDNGFMEYSYRAICDRILSGLRGSAPGPRKTGAVTRQTRRAQHD